MFKSLWITLLLLMFAVHVMAQSGDCPDLVSNALTSTERSCSDVTRNQACYGNFNLDVEAQDGAPAFEFEQVGDTTDLTNIQSMQLEPMDVSEGVWGIALLRVEANLPDDEAVQTVTILIFGDVEITNEANQSIEVGASVNSDQAVNVRLAPDADAVILTSLQPGTTLVVTGRNADSSWLRVRLNDGSSGWISAPLLNVDARLDELNEVDSLSSVDYGPMQAFVFTSGIDDRGCDEAPDSGLLIQTPAGAGEINLLINEVDIRLGSTAYLTAGPDDDGTNQLRVHTVEGTARIEAEGVAQYASAGQQVSVPLDDNMRASDQPAYPVPYDGSDAALPVQLLEREIEIAEPLIPDPSAPIITRVDYSQVSRDTTREVIHFSDSDGDAAQLNMSLVEASAPDLTYEFIETSIDIPAEQQTEATIVRETVCNEEAAGVEALFRIAIEDEEGHESNPVEYRILCPIGS
jgi:uncharacterized protein YgiM (DUF1202 family)